MRRQIANPNTFFVILAAFMLLAVQVFMVKWSR